MTQMFIVSLSFGRIELEWILKNLSNYCFPYIAIWTRWLLWNCCWAPSYLTGGKEFPFSYFPPNIEAPTREVAAVQSLPFSTAINYSGFHRVLISKWSSISEHLHQSLERGSEWRKRWNRSHYHSIQMRSHLLLPGQKRPSAIDLCTLLACPLHTLKVPMAASFSLKASCPLE